MIDLEGLAGHRGSAFGWVGQQWEGKQVSEVHCTVLGAHTTHTRTHMHMALYDR